MKKTRLIAFYFPQYHRVPENDRFWGKGFTEWTNVKKAKPLYKDHYQPHVPADLGYYNLLSPKTREYQARLAKKYGIEAFCYWHYWFAGKRIMSKPFNKVLKSGNPKIKFCLIWGNDSWTGIWHNSPNKILIKQTYPGKQDYINHFNSLLSSFKDERYLTINGKKVFVVECPTYIPNPKEFTDLWQKLAKEAGLKGFYFIGLGDEKWKPVGYGFHAKIRTLPRLPGTIFDQLLRLTVRKNWLELYKFLFSKPNRFEYKKMLKFTLPDMSPNPYFPTVIPNWDNTPRCGKNGFIFENSTPELFKLQLERAFSQIKNKKPEERIIFIKSWNEWGEGNYLEPDEKFGYEYLEVLKQEIHA